jgi:hypothetical protein
MEAVPRILQPVVAAGWRLAVAGVPKEFQDLTRDVSAALSDFEHHDLMQIVLSQPGACAGKEDEHGDSTGDRTAGRPDNAEDRSDAITWSWASNVSGAQRRRSFRDPVLRAVCGSAWRAVCIWLCGDAERKM